MRKDAAFSVLRPRGPVASVLAAAAVAAAVAAALPACRQDAGPDAGGGELPEAVADSAEVLLRVRRTARLYTAEYQVHKIVTHEDVRRLHARVMGHDFSAPLPLGERKVAIPIDVTLQAYVDFAGFAPSQVQRSPDGRRLNVVLPDPKVCVVASRVDHAATRQFRDLLRSDFSDAELAGLTEQGVRAILLQVPQMGILETARQSAAATLIPLFAALGYGEEDIVVSFRKEFTERDLPFYFDAEGSSIKPLKSHD